MACKVAWAAWAVGGDHPSLVSWHRPVAPSVIRDRGLLCPGQDKAQSPCLPQALGFPCVPELGHLSGKTAHVERERALVTWSRGQLRAVQWWEMDRGAICCHNTGRCNMQDVTCPVALCLNNQEDRAWITSTWSICSGPGGQVVHLPGDVSVRGDLQVPAPAWSPAWAPHAALPPGDQWPLSTDASSGLQPKC